MIGAALLLGQVAQQAQQAQAASWTPREIEQCKDALTCCWLLNRPLDLYVSADRWEATRAKVRAHIAGHCEEIIIAALAELRDREMHYASESAKTAEHYGAHPDVLGTSTGEMVDSMQRFATEHTAKARPFARLITKVQLCALPTEVLAFDPTTQGGC